jgi:histone deacetylase 1/2
MMTGLPSAFYTPPPAPGPFYQAPPPPAPSPWDPHALANAFSTVSLTPPPASSDWVIDSGATSHIASNPGMVTLTPSSGFPSSIIVGNGATLPVVGSGYSTLPGPFHLNDVLIAPNIVKNLLSVRKFTTDNLVSVAFDPLGVSVKDLRTRTPLLRCESSGPLYTLQLPPSPSSPCALIATPSPTTWHQRLGHPGAATLHHLAQESSIVCNSKADDVSFCHACQLGRHVRLPFSSSSSRASQNFDLIHCDLWTSPVPSVSGFKYYLIILDDCSHYIWTFPLRLKSDTLSTLSNFFAYVHTQFGCTIKSIQCDNGREFDNSSSRTFFLAKGVSLRMSCPYTSQQNGKAERMLRTINNATRTLLFQASMPPPLLG